jgi:bifunctional non-homologous end joining protein LigD
MTLSFPVIPMKAVLGKLPPGDGWAYEIKWDGYRTIAHCSGGRARLQSTAGHDVSDRWPEIADLGDAINASTAILDGELVALDEHGHPRFELIQNSGVGATHEAVYYLFDVLSIGGTDTIELPYDDRRRLLRELVDEGEHWRIPEHRLADGQELVDATAGIGLEGVVAKRRTSIYRPGARSKDWVKVKNREKVEVVIGGFTAGSGARETTFGALLVGRRRNDRLEFAGGVGTGFDHATLGEITEKLTGLVIDHCPFDPPPPTSHARGATWVEPSLSAVVEIAEFTNEGLVRQASFVELIAR